MLTSCVDTTKKEGRTGWLGHKCQSQPQPRHDAVGRFFASFTFPITISCACQSCFYTLALPLLCCSSSLVSTVFTFPSTAQCRPFSKSSPIHRYRYYTLTANRIAATVGLTLEILFYCQVPVYSILPTFIHPPPEPVSGL